MPQGERTWAALEGTVTPYHLQLGYKVWTWEEVTQELINYSWRYGPVTTVSIRRETKGVRCKVANTTTPQPTQAQQTLKFSFSVKPCGQNIDRKCNCLWTLGWQKGIPWERMDGLSTDRSEKLVNWWPGQKLKKLDRNKVLGASALPRKPRWTVLHLKALIWSCLNMKRTAQECLVVEDLACDQVIPACYGRLGWYHCILWRQDTISQLPASSYLMT